ncbi:MbcA/ParS/Xre antitoxin family protein [Pseudomonas sp. MM211]|uniref:type II RES/Xre toxin-antitoxin system antitoxin n=1 Tax=Pseudomonas sp. MM211 TaxID=2866808 RepID=UPI001CED9E9D|nr:antitoxin Xre/MbcA/ParS toxin-binding domain-containing protein [Pseudomonas sp. MM211]UCJ17773.1 MbcA/ParS/Xre antitoxin family protein [Pseudomonas sp. MM211]
MTITAMRQAKQGKGEAQPLSAAFWAFSAGREKLSEAERLQQIRDGFAAELVQAVKATFALPERNLEILLNASISTLERRRREHKLLDPVASERLDRIAMVCQLAEEVFESRQAAADWMSRANQSLGGQAPIMLCETEIGAKQVRRVLNALDWGGAA